MSNMTLAIAARKAVRDTRFVRTPGYCQRFVREVLQSVYGEEQYAAYCKVSARLSCQAWKEAGLAVPLEELTDYPQVGDILYKTGGMFGHVGIYVGRLWLAEGDKAGYVAENSSTLLGRVQGAKGYRSLQQFGRVQYVVRLPEKS